MNTTGKLFLATSLGTIAGAAAGVLLAPKSGKETREDIADKVTELKDQLEDLSEKSKQVAEDLKESVQEHAEELKAEAKKS